MSLRRDIERIAGGSLANTAAVAAVQASVDAVAASVAALPPPPVAFVINRKPSDTSRSSTTTLAVDPTLQVSVNASGRYTIRGRIWYTTSVAGGFKWSLDGPAISLIGISRFEVLPGATAFSSIAIDDVAYTTAQTRVVAATSRGRIDFDMDLLVGGAGGNVGFWWAQGVSDGAATKVLAGSYLEVL